MKFKTPGPWDDEADYEEWTTRVGLTAFAQRKSGAGYWCGYVVLPDGHPLRESIPNGVRAHGNFGRHDVEGVNIACVGRSGRFVVGFDCGHADDLWPAKAGDDGEKGNVYRTLAYVRQECEQLAAQLADPKVHEAARELRGLRARIAEIEKEVSARCLAIAEERAPDARWRELVELLKRERWSEVAELLERIHREARG